jgi:prepilin-type N-terminal cleavage/methylation domain-containing protein
MTPAPRTQSKRETQRGYTLVELMAAVMVLGAGLMGILAMQGATVNANRRANEVTTATTLARRWQERLRRDALQWNFPSYGTPVSNITNTWYFGGLLSGTTTNWVLPTQPTSLTTGTPLESAAADYWGNDVPLSSGNRYFCTHIRLTRLIADELVRAEVRVWWFRQSGDFPAAYNNCGAGGDLEAMGSDTTRLRWIYMTQAIDRHEL